MASCQAPVIPPYLSLVPSRTSCQATLCIVTEPKVLGRAALQMAAMMDMDCHTESKMVQPPEERQQAMVLPPAKRQTAMVTPLQKTDQLDAMVIPPAEEKNALVLQPEERQDAMVLPPIFNLCNFDSVYCNCIVVTALGRFILKSESAMQSTDDISLPFTNTGFYTIEFRETPVPPVLIAQFCTCNLVPLWWICSLWVRLQHKS